MKKIRKSEKIKKNSAEISSSRNFLIAPWITEAATAAVELNKYVFKVDLKATKDQIKKSVENSYKVKVISVNTVKIAKKFRNYGQTPGWKSEFKKAIVTLKEGDKIELFEGV